MRHGLMTWREAELSGADVLARQARLQAAMGTAGLDAMLLYTNHVRPAAVTWATGFTPYWADALLMVPRTGAAVFATALSNRVGGWIAGVNPTVEIVHGPAPGRIVGQRLAAARRIGVLELDRLPGGLFREIAGETAADIVDGSAVFATARDPGDGAERALAARADALARAAFAAVDPGAGTAGGVTGPAERAARLEGAEEVYVAIAPDLARDSRLARLGGDLPLGPRFALRLSVARHGVWVRRTVTFAPDAAEANAWFGRLAGSLDLSAPIAPQIAPPGGTTLRDWRLEAPRGARPLASVAGPGQPLEGPVPYAVLTVALETPAGPWLGAAPIAVPDRDKP
jgi:hypothetical protein